MQSLAEKVGYDPAIVRVQSRAVSVEDPNDPHVDTPPTVVRHDHRLGETLGLVIHATRTERIHIPPVLFRLRMDARVAIDLTCRSMHEPAPLLDRQAQHLLGADRADTERLHRQPRIPRRRSGTGEVEDEIDFPVDHERFTDVLTAEGEPCIIDQMTDIPFVSSAQIVDRHNLVPIGKKTLAEMRAKEPGAAGYEHPTRHPTLQGSTVAVPTPGQIEGPGQWE